MSERPAICFVALNAFPMLAEREDADMAGGAELQQVLVAKGLAQRGYRVSMICRDFGQRQGVEIGRIKVLKAFRLDAGIPVVRFVWPRFTSIWRCLREAGADIYYQRTAGMLTGIVAAFCARNGKRSVFAAAGNPDLEPNTPRIRYTRDRWIYEYGLRNVDRILVQNEEQVKLCCENFGRSATLVPNCYPAPPASVAAGDSGTGHVLWVGSIRRIKRPKLFLDLASAMPEQRFRMIGGPGRGEEGLYRAIEDSAAAIPNLEFTGFVPYSKIDPYFDGAAVVVNTSESEGFPNTFLQAWSRGVPTVSYVDSGARYEGLPIGRQVASRDEMKDCVEQLLGGVERTRLGERCRRYYEENHSPGRVLDLYENLFRELLDR